MFLPYALYPGHFALYPASMKLSHYDDEGRARMVDVSGKPDTRRTAEASAFVAMKPEVLDALPQNPKDAK